MKKLFGGRQHTTKPHQKMKNCKAGGFLQETVVPENHWFVEEENILEFVETPSKTQEEEMWPANQLILTTVEPPKLRGSTRVCSKERASPSGGAHPVVL